MQSFHPVPPAPGIMESRLDIIDVLWDHQGKPMTSIFVSGSIERTPKFAFQVYLLHGARELAKDPTFHKRLWMMLDLNRYTELRQCYVHLYLETQPSIVACIEHHEKEMTTQAPSVHVLIPSNDAPSRHTYFKGFLVVIDGPDWERDGLIFTKFDPQPSEEEFLHMKWKKYIYEKPTEIVAFKVKNVKQTSTELRQIWFESEGCTDPGPMWKGLDLSIFKVPDPVAVLQDFSRETPLAYPLNTFTYDDFEGLQVISLWDAAFGNNCPKYCYHAYVRPTSAEESDHQSHLDIFRSVNKGLIKSVAWRLDIHKHSGSLAKCMRNYVQGQRKLRSYGKAPESYECGGSYPFNDVFIVKNIGKHQLVSNHPIAYETYGNTKELEPEIRLCVANFKNVEGLSERLYGIWSLCKHK